MVRRGSEGVVEGPNLKIEFKIKITIRIRVRFTSAICSGNISLDSSLDAFTFLILPTLVLSVRAVNAAWDSFSALAASN